MSDERIQKAIVALESEKKQMQSDLDKITEVIRGLKKMVGMSERLPGKQTILGMVERILMDSSQPRSLDEIISEIDTRFCLSISRGSLDAALSRYFKNQTQKHNISRLGGGLYGTKTVSDETPLVIL